MHRVSVGLISLVCVLVLATAFPLTPVSAQDTARQASVVTFFGHIFGHGLDAPMPANTQFPKGEDNYGLGTFDWCTPAGGVTLGAAPDPAQNCEADPNNKLALFSTAGFVQVSSGSEFDGGGGYAQLHNERGGAKDALLDTTIPIQATLFMSMDMHSWSVGGGSPETYCPYPNPRDTACLYPYWGWDPGVMPEFVLKAKLYYAVLGEYGSAASDMPPIREAIESGSATLVAEGASSPQLLVNGLPGNPNVHQLTVDLGTPLVDAIPKEANFFLVYSFQANSPAGEVSLHTWRIWSGEFFPPSFTLPVKNAFDVELVVPQFIHEKLAILGLISTPWGSYDVDPESTTLTIEDESGNEVTPDRIEAIADFKVAHGAHYKPVNVTFVWDYKADRLPPGTYTATISARNHQGSASAACSGKFTVREGGIPGGVEVGQCGLRTDPTKANAVGDDTAPAAGGSGGRDAPTHFPDLPVVEVASAGIAPALAPTTPLAILLVALVIGRWMK